jgi:hypothetical protein
MKPAVRVCILLSISCALAPAQPTPQQIQQHQMAEERALQREQEQREQEQRDAQMEKMRDIDRQQAEDARERDEKARQQAITAQENLYVLQQEEQQKAAAQAKAKADAEDQGVARTGIQRVPSAQTAVLPAAPAHWSFSNMTTLDKAGIAGLGVILIALAYAAGIIPAKRILGSRNSR